MRIEVRAVKNWFLISLLLVLTLTSCSTGKRSLERGNYLDAVMTAISRLRQNPDSKKAQATLADAYPNFIDYNQDQINRLKGSGDPFKWERVLGLYSEMNRVYDEIQRAPAAKRVIVSPGNYLSQYEDARIKAAEARYTLGERDMALARQYDRPAAKRAYEHYEKADELYPGFRDAQYKMREARELAIVRVIVEPIPMPSRSLDVSNEFFQNQMLEYLRNTRISPFVEFYSVQEGRSRNIQPNQVVRMAFDDFIVGQTYIQETVEDRTRDSVVIGKVKVMENGKEVEKDVYGTVKAKVHVFRKALDSSGQLDFQIMEPRTQTVVTQRKFTGAYTWFDFWGFFNGDERALTAEDRQRLRNSREIMPPPPQALFVEFTKPIYSGVTQYIQDFYRNY